MVFARSAENHEASFTFGFGYGAGGACSRRRIAAAFSEWRPGRNLQAARREGADTPLLFILRPPSSRTQRPVSTTGVARKIRNTPELPSNFAAFASCARRLTLTRSRSGWSASRTKVELAETISLAALESGKQHKFHFGPTVLGYGPITGTSDADLVLRFDPVTRTLDLPEISGQLTWKRLFYDPANRQRRGSRTSPARLVMFRPAGSFSSHRSSSRTRARDGISGRALRLKDNRPYRLGAFRRVRTPVRTECSVYPRHSACFLSRTGA